jgi:GNAT superfamily N-acetyltransferase
MVDASQLREVYLASYEDAYRDLVPPLWLRDQLAQRRGAGRALLSLACATLRSQGCAFATLWVPASDTRRARPLYERLGRRSDGTIRPFEAELTPEWAGRLDDVRYRTTV